MKKYDRETGKYIPEDEYNRKQNRRKLCKGGREHDYILTLPTYVRTESTILGIDIAEKFYEIEARAIDKINEIVLLKDKELQEIGVKTREFRTFKHQTKHLICSVCKKQSYEHND